MCYCLFAGVVVVFAIKAHCCCICSAATAIVSQPLDQFLILNNTAMFQCGATSDPSTPITYSWYFNDDRAPIRNAPDDVFIDSNNTLHVMTGADPDDALRRAGAYRCHVTNGYSEAEAAASLVFIPFGQLSTS